MRPQSPGHRPSRETTAGVMVVFVRDGTAVATANMDAVPRSGEGVAGQGAGRWSRGTSRGFPGGQSPMFIS